MEKVITAHITAEFVQNVPGGPWFLRFAADGEGHPLERRPRYTAEIPAVVEEPVTA